MTEEAVRLALDADPAAKVILASDLSVSEKTSALTRLAASHAGTVAAAPAAETVQPEQLSPEQELAKIRDMDMTAYAAVRHGLGTDRQPGFGGRVAGSRVGQYGIFGPEDEL
jgi:hypothetical protein